MATTWSQAKARKKRVRFADEPAGQAEIWHDEDDPQDTPDENALDKQRTGIIQAQLERKELWRYCETEAPEPDESKESDEHATSNG
ncbi:hypothetical protein PI125_g23432 [Phytophthora idaei]|nr:hypothetical protein PI125_g23432 [Phytophthora idaei]